MENSKDITIVIPCYNNGYLLAKMIECVLRQTLKSWKLVVVDDCSTDNTQEIINELAKKDVRINLFVRNREPKGAQTCRNIGMEKAEGKFVVFFDADDLISTTCLEKRVAFMNANPEIDYASFPAKAFTDEEKLPLFSDRGKKFGVGNDQTDILRDLLRSDYYYSSIGWTNIYKIESLSNIRWDENIKVHQDFDFGISIFLAGLMHKFSNSNELDYFYRSGHGNNISSDFISNEKCNSTIYLFSKVLIQLEERSDYNQRKNEFAEYVVVHFRRIILSGSRANTLNYIEFCEKYYNNLFVYRLKFIGNVALKFNNKSLRKLILYSLTTIFFGKR